MIKQRFKSNGTDSKIDGFASASIREAWSIQASVLQTPL